MLCKRKKTDEQKTSTIFIRLDLTMNKTEISSITVANNTAGGTVNHKPFKRSSTGTGFQSAFCSFLLLALLAQPIRTLGVEPVGSPLPVGRAETPAANHATDKANYKIKSTFRNDFTQDDIKLIQDIISILLFTAGFYAGVTIPQIYWKVKLYWDKKSERTRRYQ